MSKRGSRLRRYALMNAAHNVVKNNATFKNYYDKKMTEGRSHYNASGTVPANLSVSCGRCSLTESNLTPVKEVCIPISVDFENAPLRGFIKVTLFTTDTIKKFFANLGLTFHSWSDVYIP